MTTDVYVDILFIVNLGMDCLCLLLTARLLRRRVVGWRLALSCLAGGGYAVAALFVPVGRVAALGLDMAACLLLCGLAFPLGSPDSGRGRVSDLLRISGVYLLVSLVMGGIMTGLSNLLNRAGCAELLADTAADSPAAWLFALLALVGGGISLWGGKLFRRAGRAQTATLTVTLGEKTVTLTGLVDSGNLLTDPLDGRPVVPLEREAVVSLLSPALLACLEARDTSPATLCRLPEAARLRVIPAATATGDSLLLCIRPDRMSITTTDRREGGEVKALIAPIKLSTPVGDGSPTPQALIPATLL